MDQSIAAAKPMIPRYLGKIRTAMTYPGAFFRYQSAAARGFYHNIARLAHPRTFMARCLNLNELPVAATIRDDEGYAIIAPDAVPPALCENVLAELRGMLSKIDIESFREGAKKPYLIAVIPSEKIGRDSATYKFLTHPSLVNIVARYLRCMPILSYVAVWYSPNEPGDTRGSQKFHLDHEDFRQIKGFMFVEDIAPDQGPFTLLPAHISTPLQKSLHYRMTPDNKQIDDADVYKYASQKDIVPLTGKAGTIALIDTSRCFHYGSRAGQKPRIMLSFQYVTPFAFVLPWKWRSKIFLPHLAANDLPPLEKKLIGLGI